jgi:tetratricopeptide (TPR) repeat protein
VSQSDFVSRGQALVAAGQFQEAVKVCRLGLLGRPTTVEGRVVLGQALLALKRYDEVLAEMRVALELDHSSIPAQILKGEALLRKGDTSAAVETLHKAREASPGDARILQLLGQCEQLSVKGPTSTSHPAVSFVGSGDTKHYPNHQDGPQGDEDSGGGYTRPTSLSAPGALRRSSQRSAVASPDVPDGTPTPEQLAVGDKSGTVEVDPELDGIEIPGDPDFDDLAAPPVASGKPRKIGGSRGSVVPGKAQKAKAAKAARAAPEPAKPRKTAKGITSTPTPTLDLDEDEDVIEVQETHLPKPRTSRAGEPLSRPSRPGGTALRNAIGMSSGPLDQGSSASTLPPDGGARPKPKTLPPPNRDRDKPLSAPPPLVHSIAAQPNAFAMTQIPIPPTPAPLPPAPHGQVPRLAAALPTVAAMQPPPPPLHPPLPPPASPASIAASVRPTLAISAPIPPLSAAQQQSAAAVDALFGIHHDPRASAAAFEPTARPGEMIDPNVAAAAGIMTPNPAAMVDLPSISQRDGMRTGMRRPRSRAQIALWIFLGVVVIGGGVFAGFQIRAMRLQKQIAAMRGRATDLAKADTWVGWAAAFSSLSDIANASSTTENRAAFARARAFIAFEFADGLPEAKAAVDALGTQGGLDTEVAAALVALAQDDPKAAKIAADAVTGSQDPAAMYAAGEAAILNSDPTSAQKYMKFAFDKEPRPFYGVGLARAYAAGYQWDEAATTLDKILAANPDHPAALIERARVYTASGRIAPSQATGLEIKAQLDKVVAEGALPLAKQTPTRGVSPAQAAYAELALARVDFARNDQTTARGDLRAATGIGVDDERFAEEWIDTLYSVGDYTAARAAAERVLQLWPASRRARISLAQILLATGHAQEAEEALTTKQVDAASLPLGLAVRGQIRASVGAFDEARADFEAALKKLPNLEPALVGRAWLELATGDVEDAKKRIEPHVSAGGVPPAVAVVYAAILRRSGDEAARDKAKQMLERVVNGAPGPDTTRAQLELARLYVAMGDFDGASKAYAEAIKGDGFEAKLENALFQIDGAHLAEARETLETLYKAAGDKPRADLVLELARARSLAGQHEQAKTLLEQAEKLPNVVKWKLEREKGRLALRKGDFTGAATALSRALDASGSDAETLLLAADTATSDDKQTSGLAEKVKKLAPERLKGQPEAAIVTGKLAIAASKYQDALTAFSEAKKALDKASHRRQAQALFGMAVAKFYLGQDAEAENDFEYVLVLDPSLYTAYIFSGNLLAQKKPKSALEIARKAKDFNPDSVDAWALAGTLAHKQGDKKLYNEAVTRLGALAPNSDQLKALTALKR